MTGYSAPAAPRIAHHAQVADYIELTKPGLTLFVTFTFAAGYYLAPGPLDALAFMNGTIGTSFVAGGAAALNQYLERDIDALMPRTARRPLPAGRISPRAGLAFALALASLGLTYLTLAAPRSALVFAALALLVYVGIYTPLKRRTCVCTFIGTIPGALPVLAGWSARAGVRDVGGWVLFLILILWQLPHFLSLAWLFRAQYEQAGVNVLSTRPHATRWLPLVAVAAAVLLLSAGLLPALLGMSGLVFTLLALLLGVLLVRLTLQLRAEASRDDAARQLFAFSLVYLPALLAMMMLDRLV